MDPLGPSTSFGCDLYCQIVNIVGSHSRGNRTPGRRRCNRLQLAGTELAGTELAGTGHNLCGDES